MRVCVVCGLRCEGRRADARHCGGPCRSEASRSERFSTGAAVGPTRIHRGAAQRLSVGAQIDSPGPPEMPFRRTKSEKEMT